MQEIYASVILDMISDAVDKSYQYTVPAQLQEKIKPGCRVLVPFQSRKIYAYVISLENEKKVEQPRDILSLQDPSPVLTEELLTLSEWLAVNYFNRRIETLRLCLPPAGERVRALTQEYVLPVLSPELLLEQSVALKKKALRQSLLLEHLALAGREGLCWSELRRKAGATKNTLRLLEQKGLIRLEGKQRERIPSFVPPQDGGAQLHFTPEQEVVWEEIKKGLGQGGCTYLLHGITGSGKTELYFRAAAAVVERGQSVLIMVPEIALTPQMIAGFRGRFAGLFALLHSSLSPGERYDQWWRVKRGEARVVLGARSAVFAPLQDIGLIVLDEEHEQTYRQEDGPRYHARDVARRRALYHSSLLLLGSATPSLESCRQAAAGNYRLLELKNRVGNRPLPTVQVVNMRNEFHKGNRGIFSRALLRSMDETLSRDEQIILFLNRRGYAGFLLCRSCGNVMQCPSCSVSMTYHAEPEHLQCHFCGYRTLPATACPRCHSIYLRNFGLGTQRLEQVVQSVFPGVTVLRMDSDATVRKDAHRQMWETFKQKRASILIGTQMIAKGLDFPNVTLVGVVAADIALNLPDFRAGERTFQLLTQVAGRAGRGEKRGHVIIQTYNPEHYSIKTAASHNYDQFVREELKRRETLLYPPFTELLLFTCSAVTTGQAEKSAAELRSQLEKKIMPALPEQLLGPAPAPLQKIRDLYRYQILFKVKQPELYSLLIREIVWGLRSGQKGTRITVDLNPMMML